MPTTAPTTSKDFHNSFRNAVKTMDFRQLQTILFKQNQSVQAPWPLMRVTNEAFYTYTWLLGGTPFRFEDYVLRYDPKKEPPQLQDDIDKVLETIPFSYRHFSKGIGPQDDMPNFRQLFSNFTLAHKGMSFTGGTNKDDWFRIGNENFIFCCICIGDQPAYRDAITLKRKWYSPIDAADIGDCWSSCDFLTPFRDINTASEAKQKIKKKEVMAPLSKKLICPPLFRGTGEEILRGAVSAMLEEAATHKLDRDSMLKLPHDVLARLLADLFGSRMEVKIAVGALPLNSSTPWKISPIYKGP
ncbi:hypothetical protein ACIQ9Q_42700 [Streptomyces sp. NPDC094438]|uniref:hypothetical protein n=1 Tax=Streptomyces sp. NPDC094438 TaxID=3366061 RepID=UPI0038077E02